MRRPLWIIAAVALVAVLVVGLVQAGGESSTEAPRSSFSLDEALQRLEGAPAPLAALHDQANRITPADVDAYEEQLRELRGHPVVVNAWAAWCGPCKLEYPIFQRVSTRLGKEIAFLGLDVADNRAAAERFLAKTPVPYPHLFDPDSRIVQSAGARGGLPATIYYDAEGERTFIHQGGYTSERDLLADIERYTSSSRSGA
jgi:cytochrome c biogenesis protein CcmG, thiol:disulfide interchange protein DsbE